MLYAMFLATSMVLSVEPLSIIKTSMLETPAILVGKSLRHRLGWLLRLGKGLG